MPRPHIEFLHAQQLPWRKGELPGPYGELECKVLSRDAETGSCSVILRYPPGWTRPEAEHLSAAHEFYVLDGNLSLNGEEHPFDSYAYLPAGTTHEKVFSERGAVVLTFFSSTPNVFQGAGTTTTDAITGLNLHDVKWTSADIDPDLDFLRIAHKILRRDANSGETTMVLNCGAQTHPADWQEKALKHPCAEEMFLLSGDIIGERGIMNAGAYFWRPPGIWHGPFGSRNGNLCLIRFMDGHHVNQWSDKDLPFSLTPDYNPDLPEELQKFASEPWDTPRPY